ncbi:hypothetical protein Tco_0345217 [Tanacetum coccineum]
MAPKRRTTRLNPGATPTPVTDTHTTTFVTNAQIQAMINEGVTAALAARDATRNGDDSHTSGTGARRPVQVARECTYPDFLKKHNYAKSHQRRSCQNNGRNYGTIHEQTRADYGSRVARLKIEDKDNFELKGQFLKELRTNTFSGLDHEYANKHIEKVLGIMDLFHIPNITIDQVMLRAFHMSLTGAASHWLRNKLSSSITTWEDLKIKFLSKYCPPTRTAKKIEEINNFQQDRMKNFIKLGSDLKNS